MGSIGTPELIIAAVVLFLLFGAKRMPEMARGVGQSLKIFKTEMSKPADSDASSAVIVTPEPAAQASTAQPTPARPATETPAAAPADPEPRPVQ